MRDQPPFVWTVSVEGPFAGEPTDDALLRFSDEVHTDARARGPACSMNTEKGLVSFTIAVEADSITSAGNIASEIFVGALERAGIAPETRTGFMELQRLEIELDDEAR